MVDGGEEVVQQVVAQGGVADEGGEALVDVVGGVHLVEAPVGVAARVVTCARRTRVYSSTAGGSVHHTWVIH